MNKLTIPSILAATVLIAGIFAFMPVEKASTVHVGIGDKIDDLSTELSDVSTELSDVVNELSDVSSFRTEMVTDMDQDEGDTYTLACNDGYVVLGIVVSMAGVDENEANTVNNDLTLMAAGDEVTLTSNGNDGMFDTTDRQSLITDNIALLADETVVLTSGTETVGDDDGNEETVVGISLLTSKDAMCTLIHAAASTNGN